MKRTLLMSTMLLALSAMSAHAAGLNLRWQSCFGDAGAQNRTSACTSNLGSAGIAVGSFQTSLDAVGVTGIEIIVDAATAGTALPAWWAMPTTGGAGFPGCRSGAVTANATISPAAANCFDWASGAAAGGLASARPGLYGATSERFLIGFAVPAASAATIPANTEMFAFNLVISNTKTTGTGSCAGCSTPACLVFNNLRMALGTATAPDINTPTNTFGSNYITWQGGAGVTSTLGGGCPAATPTRNSTWSGVKSLYR